MYDPLLAGSVGQVICTDVAVTPAVVPPTQHEITCACMFFKEMTALKIKKQINYIQFQKNF